MMISILNNQVVSVEVMYKKVEIVVKLLMICIMVYNQEYFTPLFQLEVVTFCRISIRDTPVEKIIKAVKTMIFVSYFSTQ